MDNVGGVLKAAGLDKRYVDPKTGEEYIPASRRADGTIRKARRTRAGYIPPDEQRLYRAGAGRGKGLAAAAAAARRAQESAARVAATTDSWEESTKGLTRAQKKNAARKKKRAAKRAAEGLDDISILTRAQLESDRSGGDHNTKKTSSSASAASLTEGVASLSLGSSKADGVGRASRGGGKAAVAAASAVAAAAAAAAASSATATTTVVPPDPAKRLKKLRKKLKQIVALASKPESELDADQRRKVSARADVEAEIAALEKSKIK